MELKFLKKDKLDYIKANMETNLSKGRYYENKPWVEDYLGNDFFLSSGIIIDDFELLTSDNCKEMPNTDLENCKIIYEAMKNISIDIASEPKIWIYLSHVTFWDYMRKRWPMEDRKLDSLKSRYFFTTNIDRSLTSHGISRLWWIAHTTYDESYEDPYHLTKILLTTQDVAVTFFARNFSRNTNLIRYILKALDEYCLYNKFPLKNHIRELAKDFNRIGGIRILDTLPYEEIESIVFNSLKYYNEIGLK